jgi:hypothetical protein
MQTIAFEEHLSEISLRLRFKELTKMIEEILFSAGPATQLAHYRDRFATLAFQAANELAALNKDEPKKKIISHLGVDHVLNPTDLGMMITALNSQAQCEHIRTNSDAFRRFFQLFYKLSSLEKFHYTVKELLVLPNKASEPNDAIIEFEVIDVGDRGISFDRFEAILKSIHHIHDSVARGLEIEGRLAIAYLDSGSNSIVSIKSDGKIIDGIRRLISEIWDRIRFGKYHKLERKLEAAEAGISFVEMIEQKQKDGKMDHEFASKLKHSVISETISLFGKAATLREIQIETTLDNRKLLIERLDVKLLEAGTDSQDKKIPEAEPETPDGPKETGGTA